MYYNTADIRQFLIEYFTDEELSVLCYDYFRPVYDAFTTGMTKGHKVQLLIEYCERREIIPNLLAAIQEARPEQYRRRFSEVTVRPGAPLERNSRQVFISHAHQDADFAHRLANDLQNRGWRVWIAPDSIRPGEKWAEAINRGLGESGVFILTLTPAAVRSRWVETETNVAVELEHKGQVRFIPLDVKRCDVPLLWSAYQRVLFRGGYEAGLAALLRELEGKKAAPIPLSHRKPAEAAPTLPGLAKRLEKLPRNWPVVGGGLALLCLVVVLVVAAISGGVNPPLPSLTTPTPTLEPGATHIAEKDGMVLVYVPAGEFLMGSGDSDSQALDREKPQHTVYLDAFWMDQTEVTNAQYNKCVEAGECEAPSYADNSRYNSEDQPVVGVDWNDAETYCKWAGRALPTEAQWEKAACGTDGQIYPWGDQPATCDYAVMDDDSGNGCGKGTTWPVGSKPKGASPYGALDMAGNVWEWVADWYSADYYAEFPAENPPGPSSGEGKVLRGGSFGFDPGTLRAAHRLVTLPDYRNLYVGFRCARSPEQ